MPRGIVVALSGPTGAGKTTVAKELASRGHAVMLEPTSQDPDEGLLVRNGYEFQRRIVTRRAERLLSYSGLTPLFVDRSLQEDAAVFFPLHRQLGHLTDEQFLKLTSLACLRDQRCLADTVIVLTATSQTLTRRLIDRRAPAWLLRSLQLQCDLYEAWARSLVGRRLLRIDSSAMSPSAISCHIEQFIGVNPAS